MMQIGNHDDPVVAQLKKQCEINMTDSEKKKAYHVWDNIVHEKREEAIVPSIPYQQSDNTTKSNARCNDFVTVLFSEKDRRRSKVLMVVLSTWQSRGEPDLHWFRADREDSLMC
jgi:hypothetical protein